jgi:hypothetical protein
VNPWAITREIFGAAAKRASVGLLGVEIVCSDAAVHRERVERRQMDVPGQVKPNWQKVLSRDYTPWLEADMQIDTASITVEAAVSSIVARLE